MHDAREEIENGKQPRSGNRLKDSLSPYLQQHAGNPVDWYPWCDEAFEKAEKENRPVFLSIGYSTCHWCHVMERESFEDPEVAELLNSSFVPVKVDREERPDIDKVYMSVCQMLTGSGGWPLTIVMTPRREPFFAATYIPRKSRFGRVGMLELLPRITELWENSPENVADDGARVTEALLQNAQSRRGAALGANELRNAYEQLFERYDHVRGGFGTAPKFPAPHNLLFLLRYWKRSGERRALEMAVNTLEEMSRGGICDQVGFGFHRYSTDADWRLPHFEKMLYDQAMISLACLEAYQATGRESLARTAREVFTYVLRDLRAPEGGFYCAEDADSEGVEGKYYIWTVEELRDALTGDELELVRRACDIREEGNFPEQAEDETTRGRNILFLRQPLELTAGELDLSEQELRRRLDHVRARLFEARERRPRPGMDTKVLTDWNGMMVVALARGGAVLNEPEYLEAACRAADFLLTEMRLPEGRLLHRWMNGEAGIEGMADDYAFLVWGLIELYQACFEVRYLEAALELNSHMLEHFWDSANGGAFCYTAEGADELPVRSKEIYDAAVPSANSAAALNLVRLARLTGNTTLEHKAEQVGKAFAGIIRQAPAGFTSFLCALDFMLGPSAEVVIAEAENMQGTEAMLRALRSEYHPRAVVVLRSPGEEPEIARIAEFSRGQRAVGDSVSAYVCVDHECRLPTSDPEEMLRLIGEAESGRND